VPVDVLDEVVPDFLLTGGEHSRSSEGVGDWVERVFVTRVEIPADGVNKAGETIGWDTS
jgi:hypothetical protein